MKILITGGLGVIGSYFANLNAQDNQITIIDSAEEQRKINVERGINNIIQWATDNKKELQEAYLGV